MIKAPEPNDSPWAPYEVFQVRLGPEIFFDEERKRNWHHAELPTREYKSFLKAYTDAYNASYSKSTKRIALLSRMRTMPDVFTISVGVVDPEIAHEELDGSVIDYEELFEALYNVSDKNYDPLITIRKRSDRIRNKILQGVKRIAMSGEPKKESFIAFLKEIGASLANDVKDYIESGKAPPLSGGSIYKHRIPQKKENPSLYPGGIWHPLLESGQLLDSISFRVFAEQSPEMKLFTNRYVDKLGRNLRRIRRLKRVKNVKLDENRKFRKRQSQLKMEERIFKRANFKTIEAEIDARARLDELEEIEEDEIQSALREIRSFNRYVTSQKELVSHYVKIHDKNREKVIRKETKEYAKVKESAIRLAVEILNKHKVPIPML